MATSHPQPSLTVDCIVFDAQDRLLLIRRKNEPFKGRYALPGGFVDVGETVEIAARRELREETSVEAGAIKLVGVYSDPNRDPRRHTVSAVFLALDHVGAPTAGDDAATAEFVVDWQTQSLAFDHDQVVRDAWALWKEAGRAARAVTRSISPMLLVSDVTRTIAFYRALGFQPVYSEPQDEPFFAILARDQCQIFVKSQDGVAPMPNPVRAPSLKWDAYVDTPDPDALFAEFSARRLAFHMTLADTSEGLFGFEIADPDGYVLFFGRPQGK